MRKHSHTQIKVGMFINIGLILFVIAVLALGSARGLFSTTNTYYIEGESAEGLRTGANVMLAGVQVGTVTGLNLASDTKPVRISLSIGEEHAELIREGTTAEIGTEGLVGERIVLLEPGASSKPVIPPGNVIPFVQKADMSELFDRADALLKNLNTLAESFVSDGRSAELAGNAAKAARNLAALSATLNKNLEGEKLAKSLEQLNQILAKMNRGGGTISGLLNDPQLYDDAKALLGQANESRIVRNLVRKAVRDAEKKRAPAKDDSK